MFEEVEYVEIEPQNKYSIELISGAGHGVLAATNISAGEIVITEEPLLVIPASVKRKKYSWFVWFYYVLVVKWIIMYFQGRKSKIS